MTNYFPCTSLSPILNKKTLFQCGVDADLMVRNDVIRVGVVAFLVYVPISYPMKTRESWCCERCKMRTLARNE